MTSMSYREKGLYAQLVCLAALTAFYLHGLLYSHAGRHWLHAVFLGLLLAMLLFRLALSRSSGDTLTDERDRAIRALGARWSNVSLYASLVVVLVLYYDHGSLQSAAHLIGILFHMLIFAAGISILRQIVAYRTAL